MDCLAYSTEWKKQGNWNDFPVMMMAVAKALLSRNLARQRVKKFGRFIV